MMTPVALTDQSFTVRRFDRARPGPMALDPVMAASTVAVEAWRALEESGDFEAVDVAMRALETVLRQ